MHACEVTSVMSDSAILLTVALQAPLSMGFSRPEYWSIWNKERNESVVMWP